jgi:uncharacterized repeat protein (TIGR01451 family)
VFSTTVNNQASGTLENEVNVSAYRCDDSILFRQDTASIYLGNICNYLDANKQVRKDPGDSWSNEIDAELDETIHVKITATNNGYGAMNHINIEDKLPTALSYVPNSVELLFKGSSYDCDEPMIINNVLIWEDLCTCLPNEDPGQQARYLLKDESFSIMFDVTTESTGTIVNIAEISGRMCHDAVQVFCSDTATIHIQLEPLIADAGGPYTETVQETLSFTGSATGGEQPYSFSWNFGDGNTSSIQNPSHTYIETGTYAVTLTVEDNQGQTDTDTTTVTIQEAADPQPSLFCSGNLQWTDITPGETLTGTFALKNNGDPGSVLNWQISSFPAWGDWSFSPSSGTDLTPGDGTKTISVTVVIPDEKNKDFTGSIKVVNTDNTLDSEEIQITLSTHKTRNTPLLDFLSRCLEHFPLFEHLLSIYISFQ